MKFIPAQRHGVSVYLNIGQISYYQAYYGDYIAYVNQDKDGFTIKKEHIHLITALTENKI